MALALLKMKEIRAMEPDARRAKLKELRDELMHERGVAAMGGAPPSPGKIRALRKNIARILTVLAQEAQGASPPAAAPPAARRGGGPKAKAKEGGEQEERTSMVGRSAREASARVEGKGTGGGS